MLANRVRNRELDAAIIAELPEPDVEMKSLRLIEEKMMVVAPPDYELSSWRAILAAYSFIRLNRHAGMGKVIDSALKENQVQVQEAMELDSSEVVIGMVRAGLGDGVIPAGRLRQIPPAEVVAMPFGELPIHLRVVLIEHINNPRSDLSKLVYDQIKQMTTLEAS